MTTPPAPARPETGERTRELAGQVARLAEIDGAVLERMQAEALGAPRGVVDYGDYQSDGWWTVSLLNHSGDPMDTVVGDGRARATTLLEQMPATAAFLDSLGPDLMNVRPARLAANSFLWPHRDCTVRSGTPSSPVRCEAAGVTRDRGRGRSRHGGALPIGSVRALRRRRLPRPAQRRLARGSRERPGGDTSLLRQRAPFEHRFPVRSASRSATACAAGGREQTGGLTVPGSQTRTPVPGLAHARSVPFRDLPRLHAIGAGRSRAAVDAALESCDFARPNGLIEAFENDWAEFCGVKYALATSSGSTALLLAYLAHGIGPGDEIVTVPNTFVATAEAALLLGASVRLVDIDPATHAIDQQQAIRALGPATKAVVPLHPYGRLAELGELRAATAERGIAMIEEACHAHGATRGGLMAGGFGDAAVFSFGPTKPLAGLGEGGAVVSNDDELAARLRAWNDHGRDRGEHARLGLNFRIHPIEAAYLTARLKLLPGMLAERRAIAERYNAAFAPFGVVNNPAVGDLDEHSFYVYVLDVPHRDRFRAALRAAGIGSDVHYPTAIHRQRAHQERFAAARLPACDTVQQHIVSLPMINGLRDDEVERVIGAAVRALEEGSAP